MKCLMPKCNTNAAWKGLCQGHYKQAKDAVEADKTTWEELESKGLAKIKPDNTVLEELENRKNS